MVFKKKKKKNNNNNNKITYVIKHHCSILRQTSNCFFFSAEAVKCNSELLLCYQKTSVSVSVPFLSLYVCCFQCQVQQHCPVWGLPVILICSVGGGISWRVKDMLHSSLVSKQRTSALWEGLRQSEHWVLIFSWSTSVSHSVPRIPYSDLWSFIKTKNINPHTQDENNSTLAFFFFVFFLPSV